MQLQIMLMSLYPWSSVSARTMEAVCLIQTSPGDQGFTNVIVYLDIPEASARLTLMSANHIPAFEVFYMTVIASLACCFLCNVSVLR